MIEIGKYNLLTILRSSEPGVYLIDEEGNEVLLPNKYVPESYRKGDEIRVFVYKDSEDRPIATTLDPKGQDGDFAYLKVKAINNIGAFLDWGLEKDLLVPFKEQGSRMDTGQGYLVYIRLDPDTERMVASERIERYTSKDVDELEEEEAVQLLIGGRSELGIKAIVNNRFLGLLYQNEVFRELEPGEEITGYIKKIREDGKIDLRLEQKGYSSIEPNADKILDHLKFNGGHLDLTDKSSPEEIKERLQMSKKVFKKAIGALYKEKHIRIEEDGVYLNN